MIDESDLPEGWDTHTMFAEGMVGDSQSYNRDDFAGFVDVVDMPSGANYEFKVVLEIDQGDHTKSDRSYVAETVEEAEEKAVEFMKEFNAEFEY